MSIRLALAAAIAAASYGSGYADEPIVRFVSVPDFINMDFQLDDPRLMNLTNARKSQLVAEIAANGPQKQINPNVGNFVGTVENGYYGASQVLLEALAAENADFFTVSGDLNYTRWPKTSQLQGSGAADHIRGQADIYYDGWIGNVVNHSGFTLDDVYTIVGDHEVGDNNWSGNANLNAKRQLIPVYREVYVDKVGNESTIAQGAYVNAPAGFEGRTYAVQRGNVLLVGLDQFETFTAGGVYTNVGSQMASVKIDVTGAQLSWLDATLAQANADPTIDHIVVMAHAPIAAPDYVKVQATSSGLKNATNENGALWQTLIEHNVTMYMPGEVHAVSMQMADDLIQVVTGTNIFQPPDRGVNNIPFTGAPVDGEQNYMVVEAYADRIDLTIKSIETKIWGHRGADYDPENDDPYKNREARVAIATAEEGFQVVGTLTIDTSSGSPVYRNRSGLFLTEWSFGAPVNIDLDDDGYITDEDALAYISGLHMDLSNLTAEQAFAMGDLNGDFQNNYEDFLIFKTAFDVNNGEGAFEAALAVPEPATAGMFMVAVGLAGASRLQRKGKAAVAAACATVCLGAATPDEALAVNDVAGSLIQFNDNGGWSWFEDERAIVDVAAGKILVSSVASVPPGDSPVDQPRNGDVEVASYDITAGNVTRFTLNAGTRPTGGLPADDHNSATLWQRPDGRYVAMYSGHHTDNLSRWRISTNPGDVSSWSAEQTFNNGINTTYSNLLYLSAENGGAGRLYNFTRTVGFDPNALVSTDQGSSWSYGGRLLSWSIPAGDPKGTGAGGSGRPYLKYASNGVDEIHFITTEDHPRNYDNSIYHGVLRNGVVYDSFGNVVDGNFFDGAAASPNDFTAIFDTDSSSLGHAWTTDLQLDAQGRPYALMTARANNTNNADHRFLYARFDGTQWSTHEIAKAGAFLYSSEGDYTGLGALDPHDPNRLFISTNVDPRNGDSLARYEIFQGVTGDGGATWNWMAITANSTVDNLRPVVPKWDEDHTALLWLRGNYQEYRVYDMDVVGLTEITPIEILDAADLNGDGFVDPTDAAMYLSGLHVDLTRLSAADARKKGDVTGDFQNNYDDYRLFKQAYEQHHGDGSLARAFEVPEPYSLSVVAVLAILVVTRTRRRRSPHCRSIAPARAQRRFPSLAGVLVAAMTLLWSPAPPACAEAVDGPWVNISGSGNGPIMNANTNSPVIGDGTSNSADAEMAYSPFTSITLSNPGEKIVFTGSVTLLGTVNSPASAGAPRTQFRFGLFDGDADPPNDDGWVGYYMSNRHGVAGSPAGTLARKPLGNSSTPLSTDGQNSLGTQGGDGTSASLFHDATYAMNMTIERNASSHLLVSATLSGSNGFTQHINGTDTTASTLGTFTFDRLVFLLGNNLDADQAIFSNLNVEFVPVPETLTLEVLAAGPQAGAMRLVNRTDAAIDFSYYEINSAAGSLDPTGWRSLDDQSPTNPPHGWGEAPGVSEEKLSEALILGQQHVAPGEALPLGRGYVGPLNDLEVWIGDGVSPLRLGDVQFVMPGDFNGDGDVDGADLAQWGGGFSGTGGLGDADFDGDSDGADFLAWQRNVGQSPPAVAAAANVPEPGGFVLAIAAALGCALGSIFSRASNIKKPPVPSP